MNQGTNDLCSTGSNPDLCQCVFRNSCIRTRRSCVEKNILMQPALIVEEI